MTAIPPAARNAASERRLARCGEHEGAGKPAPVGVGCDARGRRLARCTQHEGAGKPARPRRPHRPFDEIVEIGDRP